METTTSPTQRRPGRTARCRRAMAPAAWTAAGLLAGCQSLGDDLSDLAGSFIPPSPSEAARMAADPTDPDLRRQGIVLLSNAPFGAAPPYVALYRDYAVNESDPIVRAVAIQALARHGEPEDAERIAANLESENEQIQWEAAKGLQRVHDSKVVPVMLAVLTEPARSEDVRTAIACALGQYPQDRVFQGLVAALDARELAVNMAARRSLVTLTGVDLGLEAPAWLRWYNEASASGDAFAGQQEYLYPTYRREESLLEKLAFWNRPVFEHPAPPAGLRPSGERRTYEDVGATDDEGH